MSSCTPLTCHSDVFRMSLWNSRFSVNLLMLFLLYFALGANYMKGIANAMAGSPIAGQITWSLTFSSGGCIDFGQALLSAVEMAGRFAHSFVVSSINKFRMRPNNAPPAYAPPVGSFYAAPPAYYQPTNGGSFQAPTQVFPDRPDPNSVFVNEAPPPYTGETVTFEIFLCL